jgi:GNAT superfamily N-acetyltransferase
MLAYLLLRIFNLVRHPCATCCRSEPMEARPFCRPNPLSTAFAAGEGNKKEIISMHTQAGKPRLADDLLYEKGDVLEMIELNPKGFAAVQDLLRPFDYSLSIRAALAGDNPGRIFVNDPARPRTVLAITGEGTFLAGDYHDPTIIDPLRRLLRRIFSGTVFPSAEWCISLHVDSDDWAAELPKLVPTHQADELLGYHYLCRDLDPGWQPHLPDEYTVQRVDRVTLSRFPEEMREWGSVEDWWGTVENFFSKGISFCVTHGDDVVSWCTSTCVAGDQVEVGIFTVPGHRRRGLATAAVAATVACCLNSGGRRPRRWDSSARASIGCTFTSLNCRITCPNWHGPASSAASTKRPRGITSWSFPCETTTRTITTTARPRRGGRWVIGRWRSSTCAGLSRTGGRSTTIPAGWNGSFSCTARRSGRRY